MIGFPNGFFKGDSTERSKTTSEIQGNQLAILPMIPVPHVSEETSIICAMCFVCTNTTNIIPTSRIVLI